MKVASIPVAAAAAFLVAVGTAFLMGVHVCLGRSSTIPLSLDEAKAVQCKVSGDEIVSSGEDAQLVWDLSSDGGDGIAVGVVDILVESYEETLARVYWTTRKKPNFDGGRNVEQAMRRGLNKIRLPVKRKITGLRLDMGRSPGQWFKIRSLSLRNGLIVASSWSWYAFFVRTLLVFAAVFLLLLHFILPPRQIWLFAEKWRFAIALGVLAFAVVFEISGTSLDNWNERVANPKAEAPLFGKQRSIRSDEYAVFTPLSIAQSYGAENAYSYFSDIPRGTRTDMFSVYAQPVKHPLLAFRPFLAGHILFGFRRGLAFFWTARWLALFLVMFELFKLVTDGDRVLSAVVSGMVLFAPVVQWWGAINALAEMLIFGGLGVVLLDRFMAKQTLRERWVPLVGMAYCAVGYAMTLYPAEMIPLGYAFAALAIWVVVRRARQFRFDWLSAGCAALVFGVVAGCLAWYVVKSGEAFRLASETVYPGSRIVAGGGFLRGFGLSWGNLFFPWDHKGLNNAFVLSAFIDMFPLGLMLTAVLFVRDRRFDWLLCLLLACFAFLGFYCAAGFETGIAKFTAMGRSTAPRAFVALGFVQLAMLARAVALCDNRFSRWENFLLAFKLAAFNALIAYFAYGEYVHVGRCVAIFVVAMAGHLTWLSYKKNGTCFVLYAVVIMVLGGALVNPVQHGDANVTSSGLVRKMQEIASQDHGLWLVDDAPFPLTNYPLLAGAPSINSTNTYPVHERWNEIDSTGKNKNVWNRYSHIRTTIKQSGRADFKLLGGDYIHVTLSNADIGRLGIKYVLSARDLASLSDAKMSYRRIYRECDYGIYLVEPCIADNNKGGVQ